MIDLSSISPEVIQARGAYSTVRAAHEDAVKELQKLCGELMAIPAKVLKNGQADHEMYLDEAAINLSELRLLTDRTEQQLAAVKSLAKQKAELKPIAWPK